jgi:hypothetical protein
MRETKLFPSHAGMGGAEGFALAMQEGFKGSSKKRFVFYLKKKAEKIKRIKE